MTELGFLLSHFKDYHFMIFNQLDATEDRRWVIQMFPPPDPPFDPETPWQITGASITSLITQLETKLRKVEDEDE